MANYALIKDEVVKNIIIADADFVELIKADWDEIVELTEGLSIGIGYKKIKAGVYESPVTQETQVPAASQSQGE